MRIGIIGDVHLADDPPSTRTSTYCDDVLDAFTNAVATLDAIPDLDVILLTGDIFHSKRASRISFRLVAAAMDILQITDKPTYIEVGNHDLEGMGFATIGYQPVSLFKFIDGVMFAPQEFVVDGVVLRGVPAECDTARAILDYIADWNRETTIPVVHAPIVAPGHKPFPGSISPVELTVGFQYIIYGHMHRVAMPYKINGTTFINPGSIERVSVNDVRDTFHVAVLDTRVNTVQYLQLPLKPYATAFKAIYQTPNPQININAFVAGLAEHQINVLTPSTLADLLRMRIAPNLVDLALKYVFGDRR